ncbi:MAG: hypothetical protein GC185_12720 [Alphaproteobacteria bacterium]|nr:hypothetical protein [Alphaproteobacteria bacterium]
MLGLNNLFNSITGGVDKRRDNGETRLYQAARSGNVKAVKRLLKQGADPDAQAGNGLSPLHQAAFWGETEIVDLLLKAGADPNLDNGRGWTALHSAAVSGGQRSRAKIVDMLKKAGADAGRQDKQGWTAEDYMTLWDENAPAAEKLKKYLQIPDGLASQTGHFRPRPRAFDDAAKKRPGIPPMPPPAPRKPQAPPPGLH